MTAPREPVTALVAEDEPVLARTLTRLLATAWPGLEIVAVVEDGEAAIAQALAHRPSVLFLDIQMPGRTGLQVAEAVADDWPEGAPPPLLVFVTAYDAFAVSAFEQAAVDYVLKPVTSERLAKTVSRLQARLVDRRDDVAPDAAAQQVRTVQALQPGALSNERIRIIRAGVGNTVRMIPVPEVLCLEAADKYVTVVTAQGDALVRMSMRELTARLDGAEFVQVHRSVMVNAAHIVSATRDELGHYALTVRGLSRPVRVSRAFAHLFRPM